MKLPLLAILFVLISACATRPVKIFNVSQGLARESNGKMTIYAEGNNFVYHVNGNCVADGETKPCMWYAVAFEFAADADITLLSCKATFSEPTNDVVGTRKHVFRAPALNPTYPCALGRL